MRGLTWRDLITTLLAIVGGMIVYAKSYNLNWAIIGSWRSAVAALGVTGIIMTLVSGFDVANRSILNITEIILGLVAIAVGVFGVFIASPTLFYILAGLIGMLWLIDTSRHIRNSITEDGTTTYHRPAAAR